LNQIERSFRRADFKIAFSQGFHPKMLISHGPALPLGLAAKAEVLEFKAQQELSPSEFLYKINSFTPDGLSFHGLKKCQPETPSLFQDIKGLVYSLDLKDPLVRAVSQLEEKLTPDYLSTFAAGYQGQLKIEYNQQENRLIFYLAFNPQKPLRIQDIVEEMLVIKNPVYALTREYLVFSQGTDSRGLA